MIKVKLNKSIRMKIDLMELVFYMKVKEILFKKECFKMENYYKGLRYKIHTSAILCMYALAILRNKRTYL